MFGIIVTSAYIAAALTDSNSLLGAQLRAAVQLKAVESAQVKLKATLTQAEQSAAQMRAGWWFAKERAGREAEAKADAQKAAEHLRRPKWKL